MTVSQSSYKILFEFEFVVPAVLFFSVMLV